MDKNIIIGKLKIEEINQFSNMIISVFDEFVGKDYSKQGNDTFKEFIKPENVLDRFNGLNIFVAKYNNEIIGVLEIRNNDHISLFFVKKDFHKQGVGKILFEKYLETIKNNSEIRIITVNSSIYAEKIYEKLGFIKINEIQEKNGIKYIPMECKI
jgi:GNAT superfamily N-acetyltransferase